MSNDKQVSIPKIDGGGVASLYNKLKATSEKVGAALKKYQQEFEEKGPSKELDEKLKNFITQAKSAKTKKYDERIVITRKMDDLKKMFTSEENAIIACTKKAQSIRNDIAADLLAKQEAADLEANKKVYQEKEAAELFAQAQLLSKQNVNAQLADIKERSFKAMKACTPEKIPALKERIQKMNTGLQLKHWQLVCSLTAKYHNAEELQAIWTDARSHIYAEIEKSFKSEMAAFQQECILYANNLGTAEAKDAIDKKMDEAKVEHEQANEIAQIEKGITEDEKKAAATIAHATALGSTEQVKAKKVYEISVTSKAGYKAIISHWFEHIAPSVPLEKFATKKLESMAKDMQKLANSHDTIIIHSDHVVYKEVVKAT